MEFSPIKLVLSKTKQNKTVVSLMYWFKGGRRKSHTYVCGWSFCIVSNLTQDIEH